MDELQTALDNLQAAGLAVANTQYEAGRTVALTRAIAACESIANRAGTPQGQAAARACVEAVRGMM